MSINCRVVKNPINNKVERVEAPNGKESILYRDALNRFKDSGTALKIWAVSNIKSFNQEVLRPILPTETGIRFQKPFLGKNSDIIKEIDLLPKTRIEGLGMGANQAEGTYISTEKKGNRYQTLNPNAKVNKVSVKIENPLVVKDDIGLVDMRNKLLNRNQDQFTEEDFEMFEKPQTSELSIDDLNDAGINKLAKIVTKDLKSKGYDSIYFPESNIQEGELVVFDRNKVFTIKSPTEITQQIIDQLENINSNEVSNRETQRTFTESSEGNRIQKELKIFIGGYDETVEKNNPIENRSRLERESTVIEQWAKDEGYFIENIGEKYTPTELGGTESEIYLDKSNDNIIIKEMSPGAYNGYAGVLGRLALHNNLFPETKYEIVGFTKENNIINLVLKQPFIKDARNATQKEIANYLTSLGFEPENPNSETYTWKNKEGVTIGDMHNGNALVTSEDTLVIIDPMIEYEGDVTLDNYLDKFSSNTGLEIIDQLEKTGLAGNVYQLTSKEIEAKLKELGVSDEIRKQVIAWHGSPHYFKRFLTEKMGTGEGAQAFGWGLYFTDLESIARNYAKTLSSKKIDFLFNGKTREQFEKENNFDIDTSLQLGNALAKAFDVVSNSFSINKFNNHVKDINTNPLIVGERLSKPLKKLKDTFLDGVNIEWSIKTPNLYKVSLFKDKDPSDYYFIEWDKAKGDYRNILKNYIESLKKDYPNSSNFFDSKLKEFRESVKDLDGKTFYEGLLLNTYRIGKSNATAKDVSLKLNEIGVDGIKYPAESISKGATSETARGFNYVVFDENAITIEEHIQFQKELNKNGVKLLPNGFVINNEVYLNKDTMNDSTPIHEFSHLYNSWLKQNRPEVYNKGLDLVKAELGKKNSEIQDVIDYVKQTQPNLTGEKLQEEILTELVGRRGLEKITDQKQSGIIEWIKEAWQAIKDMLGISKMTTEEILNLDLKSYADAMAVDLLSGESLNINTNKNEKSGITELGKSRRDRTRWDSSRGSQTLEGAPINKKRKNVTGADPELTSLAEDYARRNGIDYKRQSKYVEVDVDRAMRIAEAYDKMPHAPQDPVVKEAYENLIQQTTAQYNMLVEAGYQFYFFDETNDPYNGNPMAAMEELRNQKRMGSFATEAGFGTGNEGLDVSDNPMLADTGLVWGFGSVDGQKKRVLANDLFRAVHDAFGHGLEGAGFRARGEENAWQAHARLFTGSAVAAITSETRGQNSWLNFGKYGEQNRNAKVEDTIFAPQKTGLMPEWTWKEGFDEGVSNNDIRYQKIQSPSFEDTQINYSRQGDLIVMEEIELSKDFRGQELTKKSLQKFLSAVDEEGVTVKVIVSPKKDKDSQNMLEEFYMSEGFEFETDGGIKSSFEMVRYPDTSNKKFDENGEPLLETVLDFINRNKQEVKLTEKDIFDVQDIIIAEGLTDSTELTSELNKIFAGNVLNIEALEASPIFSDSEVQNIKQNKEYQDALLGLKDKLNNQESPISATYYTSEDPFVVFSGEVNKYGKNAIINPVEVQEDLQKELGGIKDMNVFTEAVNGLEYTEIIEKYNTDEDFRFRLFSQFSSLSKIEVLGKESEAVMEPNRATEAEESLSLDSTTFSNNIELLNEAVDFWEESREDIIDALTDIENKGIEAGIDLEGLADSYDKYDSDKILGFLNSLSQLEQDITEENFNNFIEQYKDFFEVEDSLMFDYKAMSIEHKDKTLVKIEDSSKSEYDLFNENSLVKVAPGIYQRVQKLSLEDMLEVVYAEASTRDNRILPNEAYFMGDSTLNNTYLADERNKQAIINSIKLYLEDNVGSLDLNKDQYDLDVAYNMFLYKEVFENPLKPTPSPITIEEQKFVEDFDGDASYLTSTYVSDFQKSRLKEKRLNSEKYNEVYKYFHINSLGILPRYSSKIINNRVMESAKRLLSEKEYKNLIDYFKLNKNTEFVQEPSNPNYIPRLKATRLVYQNNPTRLEPYTGEYQRVKDTGVTAFETKDDFIRINNKLYEKTQEENGQSFYEEIPIFKSEFFSMQETPEVNKFDQNTIKGYLRSQVNKKTTSNKYSKEELDNINENHFDCI